MAAPRKSERGIRIAIDCGGNFTDCVGNPGTGKMEDDVLIKLLSVDPANYDDAPLEGIRRLLSKFEGKEIPRGSATRHEQDREHTHGHDGGDECAAGTEGRGYCDGGDEGV